MKHGQQQALANALLGPGDPEPVVLQIRQAARQSSSFRIMAAERCRAGWGGWA